MAGAGPRHAGAGAISELDLANLAIELYPSLG